MAVIEGGVSGELAGVGAEPSKPQHVVVKPTPYATLGHYRVARRLVPAGTTLAGNLWCFRNPTGSGILIAVHWVTLRVVQVSAPTAAIEDRFNAKIARAYTVMDTTNGTDIAPTANMQEMRTTMATASAQLREASAAAGVSGGTKTLDTNPFVTGSAWVSAALASGLSNGPVSVFNYAADVANGTHPPLLDENEGLVIANENNFGATSGIVLHLELAWAELTTY